MEDMISREKAIEAVKDALNPNIVSFVKAKMALEALPSAQPEQRLSCKNCIHLGHGYMMPCKNCKRNQMLPDWYEMETERKKND